ncbi:hypothetical protein [Streptomyces olivaceiscleroticus]|uniref:Uncharacterized protein n=1 Tax=Streptomyces olivaceiscleroticus TaxID=68245 RepID=A0ABN1AD74_9ACTN
MSTEANYAGPRRLPRIPPPPPYRPTTGQDEPTPDTAPEPAPAPSAPPRPAVPPKPSRPAPPGYRDTASFHLANAAAVWQTRSAAKAPRKPARAETSPQERPADRTPLPPERDAATLGQPAEPTPPRRPAVRKALVAGCLVLGLGLIGGAAAGSWLAGDPGGQATAATFGDARGLWHSAPVNSLFPRTLHGTAAGPGGADRTWHRIAVAPDTNCADAFDPLLAKALSPAGCQRLLRADYADATHSSVITVGVVTTRTDVSGMRALDKRFTTERLAARRDLMPRPYTVPGTLAADFGPAQRASWSIQVLPDMPLVVYAVSGFADGREVPAPQPADEATRTGATSAPAQSGLGHDAAGVADRIEHAFRTQAAKAAEEE